MVPSRQDQLSRQEIFEKTYGALVDRIDQDVDTQGLFNIAGNERQVERLVKGSFDPTSFINTAEGNDYVFRDDVMATEDVTFCDHCNEEDLGLSTNYFNRSPKIHL